MKQQRTVAYTLALAASLIGLAGCRASGRGDARLRQPAPSAKQLADQLEACRCEHAAQISQDALDVLRSQVRDLRKAADDDARQRAAMHRAMEVYSGGVCLLHGAFTLLRHEDEKLVAAQDSEGNPMILEYLGSGFLASQSGHVITNRHVVEPWWNNPSVAGLLDQGLTPTLLGITATFPGMEPIMVDTATIRVSPEGADVAVMVVDVHGAPVLPLSSAAPGTAGGERVMLMGYPTGLGALLARAEPDVAAEAIAAANDTAGLIRELSRRRAITPVVTHGALNAVTDRKLIYDAVTTSGGSGGPVFGPDGTVIGVNFAIVRDFQGSNFGVPIRFARALLP